MKKLLLFISITILGFTNVYATHNRAGEITYRFIGDATHYLYEITVNTYTNTCNTQADRCFIPVLFGDGTGDSLVPRINGGYDNSICSFPYQIGVPIGPCNKFNVYRTTHEYPGPGTYDITMDDPNRNAGTCNIQFGNSVNISFSLVTELVINPFLGPDDSPILLNFPLDSACVGQCFYHNPNAYDANDDSLYYTLDTCKAGGVNIPGWTMPPNMTLNSINHTRGDLVWCSPNNICNYSIVIKITEWRRLPGFTHRFYIGFVERDMQIIVKSCNTVPPDILRIDDTCVVVGTNLHLNVTATDPEPYDILLQANGGPFLISPAATFASSLAVGTVHGLFNWTPTCPELQLLPYLVTFKATILNPNYALATYKSVFIRVVAPAPTGLTATPSGSSIILNWNHAYCDSIYGNNPLSGYYIYRKNSCDSVYHDPCETGLPSGSGYTLIATVNGTTTTFTDNNNGAGLSNGINYSYVVVAFYTDGSESYVSKNVCAILVRNVPIITNVSVLTTDPNTGSIWIHWVKPLATSPNLDTTNNPPPYEYRLMKAQGMTGALTFDSIADYAYSSFYQLTDTGYVNTGINTNNPFTYRIDFYSNHIFKGSTNTASSVYLTSTPAGNQVNLFWQQSVPWLDTLYAVYKETTPTSGVFNFLGTTANQTYVDTGLVNGKTYCYKVVSYGRYSDNSIPHPLWNTSEIRCETPIDTVPPCQPTFNVNSNCGLFQNVLNWTNPNTYCCHDAVSYNIYFSPTTDGQLQLIYNTTDMNNTTYTHQYLFDGIPSVAGCYAITAVDTAGNESRIHTKLCVDNCPYYALPNVFTPNGDNVNDLVTPLPGWCFVKDVDMKIYDRWGVQVFQTTDAEIRWDGVNATTKMLCTDGVYFYVCIVNEIHVDGIKPSTLKGFIQLLHEKSGVPH